MVFIAGGGGIVPMDLEHLVGSSRPEVPVACRRRIAVQATRAGRASTRCIHSNPFSNQHHTNNPCPNRSARLVWQIDRRTAVPHSHNNTLYFLMFLVEQWVDHCPTSKSCMIGTGRLWPTRLTTSTSFSHQPSAGLFLEREKASSIALESYSPQISWMLSCLSKVPGIGRHDQ
ncbi:hypothetical protein LZ31DRAFT_279033 [Colletotrichum somersetense]|nr:hypothetical protein LZ31DRAFT_279033 [Colletotrichum somersetense]